MKRILLLILLILLFISCKRKIYTYSELARLEIIVNPNNFWTERSIYCDSYNLEGNKYYLYDNENNLIGEIDKTYYPDTIIRPNTNRIIMIDK